MRAVNELFAEVFEDKDTYTGNKPSDQYLTNLLEDSLFIVIVAEDNSGQIIGALCAYELVKFEQERSEIYIYDLGVLNAWRRKGVATGLIDKLKKLAVQRNAYVIYVQADDGDNPAMNLYNKLGQEEKVFHYDIIPQ